MRVGSLFSGIGGLDLGLEMAGMEVAWQTEIEPHCVAELQREWPDVENLGDIRAIDWASMKAVDLICGGFPCQPASVAGKRRGTSDDRWLWPEVTRALRILRPQYAILENVPGLLTVNDGAAFNEVQSDLAEVGYVCRWTCIRASDFGAPHRRERLFILAYANDAGRGLVQDDRRGVAQTTIGSIEEVAAQRQIGVSESESICEPVGNSFGEGLAQRKDGPGCDAQTLSSVERTGSELGNANRCGRDQGDSGAGRQAGTGIADTSRQLSESRQNPAGGLPTAWDTGIAIRGHDAIARLVEPSICPLAPGVPDRAAQIKALGNAVVPQCAEFIGRCIMDHEEGSQ